MAEEENYFIAFEPGGRARRAAEYAARYTTRLLRLCQRHNGIFLVAQVGDQPAGLIAAEVVAWRPSFSLDPAHPEVSKRYHAGEILELYVREAYRRKGLGRALMLEVERRLRARGCKWMRLEVFAPNRIAQKFYTSLGYRPRDLRLGRAL